MKRLTSIMAALMLAATPAFAEELALEHGQWENTISMTMQMDMGGQSLTMPMPAQTTSHCVNEDNDSFDPDNMAQDGCTVSDYTEEGRSISFNIQCLQDGVTMTGTMVMSLSADARSTSGTMNMTGSSPQIGVVNVVGNVSGKHAGVCS